LCTRYGRAAYRHAHLSPTYCRVPNRTIGEESKHHQKLAYALLSVVFMRLGQVRNQGLAGMIEVMLIVTSSRAVLVPLAFAVSLVALQCVICKITWVGKVTAFLAGRATTLAWAFGVANAAHFAHSRNHGWSQGY
jgi:hypothetical protein